MRGNGIRMANTSDRTAPVCLDLTRLISRVGRGRMTGIDRVELAYLAALPNRYPSFFGLVRTGQSFFLLDAHGTAALMARFKGIQPWGPRDLRSRAFRRHAPLRQAALSDLRRLSLLRCRVNRLAKILAERCGPGLRYLNVGHSNIDAPVMAAIKAAPGSRLIVLLHDVIPLEFPDFQRAATVPVFKKKLRVIGEFADLVVYPTADARTRAERQLAGLGRVPCGVVAHLGVEVAKPAPKDLPPQLRSLNRYFVALGTIEPRKNHRLLLDIWRCFENEPDAPTLVIAGQRGWNNEEVFLRLDKRPDHVIEANDLPDGAVTALMQNAAALLFPSHAEGFGLPAAEATLLGIPVVCSDLPVFREVLGNTPVYLNGSDLYLWERTIRNLAMSRPASAETDHPASVPIALPTWQGHFNTVLKLL